SRWCVEQIEDEPSNFDKNADNWEESRPNWGGDCAEECENYSEKAVGYRSDNFCGHEGIDLIKVTNSFAVHPNDTQDSSWNIGSPEFTEGCTGGSRWPTRTELADLWDNREIIREAGDNFSESSGGKYWSSSYNSSADEGWYRSLTTGEESTGIRSGTVNIRCVRDFE
ncbi:MAG: hypothetical protein ACOCQG_05695, partial [Candidatus Nanoarchaeia archaeon]